MDILVPDVADTYDVWVDKEGEWDRRVRDDHGDILLPLLQLRDLAEGANRAVVHDTM